MAQVKKRKKKRQDKQHFLIKTNEKNYLEITWGGVNLSD